MPLDIKFKPELLEAAIQQLGDRAIKGMSDKMRQIAVRIRDLARSYAPVKTGLLESEIRMAAMPIGKNRRNVFVVYIDLDASRRSGKAGELGDYAFIMEEELHPYGRQRGARRLTLGKKSQAKADSGKKVGGRFLSRAVTEGMKNIEEELAAEVRRVMGTGGRLASVEYTRSRDEDEE